MIIERLEKFTIRDHKIVFENSVEIFTVRGEILKTITDCKLNTTDSPDAKLIIDFMDEMHFHIHSLGKSLRDRNLIKSYFNKRNILASELRTIFLSENLNELCDRLRLITREKQSGNDTTRFDSFISAIIDNLLEHKCNTPIQHKKMLSYTRYVIILVEIKRHL